MARSEAPAPSAGAPQAQRGLLSFPGFQSSATGDGAAVSSAAGPTSEVAGELAQPIRARPPGAEAHAPVLDIDGQSIGMHANERSRAMKGITKNKGIRGPNVKGTKTPESTKNPNDLIKEAVSHSLVNQTVEECMLVVRNDPVKGRVIFCTVCKQIITKIPKTIRTHLLCAAHGKAVSRAGRARTRDELRQSFIHDFVEDHPELKGASLPDDVHVARINVVEDWMRAGIPLCDLDDVRHTMEKGAQLTLTDSSHLRCYIPLIEKLEMDRIHKDISGQMLLLMFDGTCRLGEAINLVGRYVTADFKIHMRLLRFVTLAKHLSAVQMAALFNKFIHDLTRAGPGTEPVGFQRDSCSTNGATMDILKPLYPHTVDGLCVSHTVNNSGDHVKFKLLEEFIGPFIHLFSNSPGGRLLWRKHLGKSPKRHSNTRWYAKAEIIMEVAENWDKVAPLLNGLRGGNMAPESTNQLTLAFVKDPFRMEAEFQAACDVYLPLVTCCYNLEGDRLEILLARRMIDNVISLESGFFEAGGMPKLEAYLRAKLPLERRMWPALDLAKDIGNQTWTGLIQAQHKRTVNNQEGQYFKVKFSPPSGSTARPKVEELGEGDVRELLVVNDTDIYKELAQAAAEGPRYLRYRMEGNCAQSFNCSTMYAMLDAVQLFDPGFVNEVSEMDARKHLLAVCNLPFMIRDEEPMGTLPDDYRAELAKYRQSARSVTIKRDNVADFTEDVLHFWRARDVELPLLAAAARKVFTLSPNSAACERVFSILQAKFQDSQQSALADVIQTTLMLRYNKRETG